jgi:type I restriction enzyme S subunit
MLVSQADTQLTRTGVGKIAIAPCDVAISQDITGVYVDEEQVDTKYLFFLMIRGTEDLKKLNQGTSINGITRGDLERYSVSFPNSLAEQRKIVAVLNAISQEIEETDALIAKYQQIKAGLMHDLFTRGLDENGELRPPREDAPELYELSPLGWLPKDWTTTTLETCAEVDRGMFTARPRNDPKYYGGDSPFIQTGDVTASIGRILVSYSQTLNKHGRLVSKSFPVGTIMITIAANIADTCILGIPMFAPDSLVGAVPKSGQNSRFLELCIRARKQFLSSRAPQSAQKNINLQDLRPLMIPKPSLPEQMRISERYEVADTFLQSLEAERTKLLSLKQGLMKDLLTGEVPMNLNVLVSEPTHV